MNVRIHFKDLDVSELAKEVILDRLNDAAARFPELRHHRLTATLSMENSPRHPGPDLFGVKLMVSGRKFGSVILEKKAENLYLAVALLHEALFERLNRCSDKKRVKCRARERKVLSSMPADADLPLLAALT